MALSRNVVFLFGFLGVFSILMVSIPIGFMLNQALWNPTYRQTDEQVANFFSLNNITVYDNQASDNLTYPSYRIEQAGLPSGQQLSIWWDLGGIFPNRVKLKVLGISLETQHWFLGVFEYWTYERLHFINKNGIERGDFIQKNILIQDENTEANGTFYLARTNNKQIQVSIFYTGNGTETLANSWEEGQLAYMISYEFNASLTAINMLTLLGQLLTFQAPQLGVSGWLGDLLNNIIAIPIYIITIYVTYKILAGLVPFASGGGGD